MREEEKKNKNEGEKRITKKRFNPTFKGTYLEMLVAEAEDEGVDPSVIIRKRVINDLRVNPPFIWDVTNGKKKEDKPGS